MGFFSSSEEITVIPHGSVRVGEIIRGQGVPAAATWALASRPAGKLDLGFLAEQLSAAHDESASMITNGDVIKAFRKWRR